MSLFSSLSTAISGMNAQSTALNHISDNIANSQTLGYKRLDTSFEELVAASGTRHAFGAVMANAEATNDIQGGIEQVDNPLAMALNGRGFFAVARPSARGADGAPVFSGEQLYSRAGDFSLDQNGYLVNGSGDVLQGWVADAAGNVDSTRLRPIRADRMPLAPVPTGSMALSANLPASAAAGTTGTTQAQAYDSLGNLQSLDLTWTRLAADNSWSLAVTQPDGAGGSNPLGTYTVSFGTNGAPAGTIGTIATDDGSVIGSYNAAAPASASLGFNAVFNGTAQAFTLDLGDYGGTNGVTQFSGAAYELRSLDVDGAPQGNFASFAVRDDGRVVANYDNGQSRTVAQVPVVTFADPDALERLSGQAFALTAAAGTPTAVAAGSAGSGRIETGAIERSNVDMAAEFSRLIIAQRAYSANTRVVTTTDELLQDTINLKR